MRLDRWLCTLGCGSRSEVQKLIRAGFAAVDGESCRDPGRPCAGTERLALRGEELDGRLERHVMLHKPAGLLTAARDRKQPTVMDLLPANFVSLGCMPVGRLDKDTTGLLLLTTDGELNHRLLAPARHVDKRYRVQTDGPLGAAEIGAFAAGIRLEEGIVTGEMEVLSSDGTGAEALLTIHEGKFHQVKRMYEAVGRRVVRLHRDRFGPLALEEGLAEGHWRELTEAELSALRQAAGLA